MHPLYGESRYSASELTKRAGRTGLSSLGRHTSHWRDSPNGDEEATVTSSYELIGEIISGKRPDAELVRPSAIMPMVIESDGRRERGYDIYSLLLKERIVFLGTPIDAMVANVIIAQLLYLAREDDEKDIML